MIIPINPATYKKRLNHINNPIIMVQADRWVKQGLNSVINEYHICPK